MTVTWYDVLGLLGVAAVLGAYAGLMARRLRGDRAMFPLINLIGAAAIATSLLYDQGLNLAALIIQVVWMAISGYGIYRSVAGTGSSDDRR